MDATPLRIVMVDDEPLARARARRLLQGMPAVAVVGEAGSAVEARAVIAAARPDLVLLDVQMPGEDGFALLRSLDPRPAVVFVTAYDQYAVQAFEENAVDYLLKPFRAERLATALERARRDLAHPEDLTARLAAMLATLGGGTPTHLERLTVRVGNRQIILRTAEVLWFGAEDKLVFAATPGDRHWLDLTLDHLERRLDPRHFARVHRGAIVNLEHAVALRPAFAGTWRLQLDDAARTEVPVSRARARACASGSAPERRAVTRLKHAPPGALDRHAASGYTHGSHPPRLHAGTADRSPPRMTPPLPQHSAEFKKRRTQNWLVLGLTYAAMYMARYNFALANKSLSDTYGWDKAEVGSIISFATL